MFSNVTDSPIHRQAGASMVNIQPTLRTALDLCKNVSFAVLFGSNDNSFTISVQSGMYIYAHVLNNTEKVVGHENRKIKIGEILDFRHSPCSECYMPTFRTLCLFHLHRQLGMKNGEYLPAYEDGTECSETSAYKIQTPGNYPEESIQIGKSSECRLPRKLYLSVIGSYYIL